MKDMNRRSRKDSDSVEVPDFFFTYADSDTLGAEIAEWYTYSEEPEFVWNMNAFRNNLFRKHYEERQWNELSKNEKKSHVTRLLEQADISNKQKRENFYRSILYIAQGTFKECETMDDYNQNLIENISLLYDCDVFNIFVDLFILEINELCSTFNAGNKYAPCISDNAYLRVILSVLYTMIEVVRCYETEVNENRFRSNKDCEKKYKEMKAQLKSDLITPMNKTNELFSVYLFQLISKFCNQNIIVLPIKKIILLLWKVLLFTLGGLDDAFRTKNELRAKFNLPIIEENPTTILNQMTPATPPPNPVDIVSELQFSNPNSSYKRKKNTFEPNATMNGLTKQTRGIDSDDMVITNGINNSSGKLTQFGISQNNSSTNIPNESENTGDENRENDKSLLETSELKLDLEQSGGKKDEVDLAENDENSIDPSEKNVQSDGVESSSSSSPTDGQEINDEQQQGGTPYAESSGSPPPERESSKSPPPEPTSEQLKVLQAANDAAMVKLKFYNQLKSLPWSPKVRQCELESFLDQERKKFLGYGDLNNDLDTLVGLPNPIHESIRILKQHLYVSLADEQIKLEEKFAKYPMSTKEVNLKPVYAEDQRENENDADESPVEILYSNLLTNLPQYLICLLKILLTSVPQTRAKNDSLQIMSDLFPEELSSSNFLTVKLGIDSNRHKEILIKAISAILILMLKHLKVNHVYQFEFMSQHLLFANCIPLILKFFNLNISNFIQSKNNHYQLDFPNCVIGQQPELDVDDLENGDASVFRWRNVFSCINLLRILNKLTKYKRSRVMMLVIFKSAPVLKKVLRIKQAMLQYYALKLLKMQTRHLGRQWRKTNMSTMSAIYQKVRHRLNDDWAFGNEQDTQGWDFQVDECALRTKIDKFNQRRYRANEEPINPDFLPIDNSFFSSLKRDVDDLPDNFQNDYESWLNEEVFSNNINWDVFLNKNSSASYLLY